MPQPLDDTQLDTAASLLAGARRLLVITGAGISADSGLPTYRGVGGLYEGQATEDGMPIEELLSGSMLRRRPELCWKYLRQIALSCAGARPNDAHHALVALERRFERLTVLTQNVDGFHLEAGSSDVIEMHGRLGLLQCLHCAAERRVTAFEALPVPPTCPRCGGMERPCVVLFGEMLPEPALDRLDAVLAEGVDAVVTVGTTSAFPYIAAPVWMARRRGLPTLEINPGRSEVSDVVDLRLQARAIEVLPPLAQRLLA